MTTLIIAEHDGASVQAATLHTVTAAQKIGGDIHMLVAGSNAGAAAQAETGSGGMVTGCQSIKGCIAYIGISYLSKTQDAGLGEASLANKAGKFVQPTTGAISAALASFGTVPASGSQSLINTSDPKGYPIINYEYMIVKKQQAGTGVADALKAFLKWTITTGADPKYLGAVGFEALPSSTSSVSQNLISSISS